MNITELDVHSLPDVLARLQLAGENHQRWCAALHRTLVCALPPQPDDLAADAHQRCAFGQWVSGEGGRELRHHPGFVRIGAAHQHMHDAARVLLQAYLARQPITVPIYDALCEALAAMRQAISALQHELEDAQYGIDPLTGALTRSQLLQRLDELHALVRRDVESCCLAMLDLDRFKTVNDTYGHAAGDCVLRTVVHRIREVLRGYDAIYRYGGEEFVIVLRHADTASALAVIERARRRLADSPLEVCTRSLTVTASFGLTALDAELPVEAALGRADQAMYAAKRSGRNAVCVWEAAAGPPPG